MNQDDRTSEFKHISVLLHETVDGLNVKSDGIYVDGTMGGAGHGSEIASRLDENGMYIGIDQDEDAIIAGQKRLAEYKCEIRVVRNNYCNIKQILSDMKITGVNGIMLDLGVSSFQLDTAERGFSYKYDAPLDMRMDQRSDITARDIINEYSESELYRVIRDYGEEQFAKNIAKHIVRVRSEKPIETTYELVDVIRAAIPMKLQKAMGHPAKKTFQAIRIELNNELDVLNNTIDDMINLLLPGGRLCIITFHSLEDRIVKRRFLENENPCTCPPEFPVCICGKVSKGHCVNKKPILPSTEEMENNSRSKSAKLRIFERR